MCQIYNVNRREYSIDIVVNHLRASKVVIDPHYEERHSESITDELIVELVKTLDGEVVEPVDLDPPYSYFVTDKIEFGGKLYKLIWMLEEGQIFIGVVNAYRRLRKMGFPSKKEIERVLKKLENVEGTLGLPENPTPLEKFRHDIQQKFVGYKLVKKISQREMAEMLGVDEGKVSKILHNRLDEFSTDRLINLYSKLNPKIELKVS